LEFSTRASKKPVNGRLVFQTSSKEKIGPTRERERKRKRKKEKDLVIGPWL